MRILVRAHIGRFGWSPGSGLSEESKKERGCPLQQFLSARKGIQVVPRKIFALSFWGIFESVDSELPRLRAFLI